MSVDVVEVVPDKRVIGEKYRKEAKSLMKWLAALTKTQVEDLEKNLSDNGQVFYQEWFYNNLFVIISYDILILQECRSECWR